MSNQILPLYQLSDEYRYLSETLSDADFPIEAINDTLEGLKGEVESKCVNVACFIKNTEATINAIKNAEEQLKNRRRSLENKITSIEQYLLTNMQKCDITEISSSPYFVIKIAKNPVKVEVADMGLLPDMFIRQKIEYSADKGAIKKAIEGGEEVTGAKLVQDYRLIIK